MTNETPAAPQGLVAKCEEINRQWLVDDGFLVPKYYSDNEWRFSLYRYMVNQRERNVLVTEHINPQTADGHTLLLMVKACNDAYFDGVENGKLNAVFALTAKACFHIGVDFSKAAEYIGKKMA